MRQAGRYMPEYRALRGTYSLLEMIKTPELACEVTLQPIDAFDLDAAIIFADILPPLEGMGLHLRFVEGEGPIIGNPLRTADDIARSAHAATGGGDGLHAGGDQVGPRTAGGARHPADRLQRRALHAGRVCHRGQRQPQLPHVKGLMMSDPAAWHDLMSKLSAVVGAYLLAQARAGAQALQLFDSWVGQLSPADYRQFALPYTQRAIAIARAANVPIIHFATDTNGYLEAMRETGADVISVDWSNT